MCDPEGYGMGDACDEAFDPLASSLALPFMVVQMLVLTSQSCGCRPSHP